MYVIEFLFNLSLEKGRVSCKSAFFVKCSEAKLMVSIFYYCHEICPYSCWSDCYDIFENAQVFCCG